MKNKNFGRNRFNGLNLLHVLIAVICLNGCGKISAGEFIARPEAKEMTVKPAVSWDYANRYHVTFAIIRDGQIETYVDPKGDDVNPAAIYDLSDLREYEETAVIAAFQLPNGTWEPATVIRGANCWEYYSLLAGSYTADQPNRRIMDNMARVQWGGFMWSAHVTKAIGNMNGCTVDGYVNLLSVDDNVKSTLTFLFTTAE
jgi:hypothetical protein